MASIRQKRFGNRQNYSTRGNPIGGALLSCAASCEKSIKAVLISKGIEPPKTHHIGALLEVVSLSEKVPQKILESSKLSDYAVSFRYPGIYEDIDTEELEEAILLAEAVLDWAQKLVESGLLRD